MRPAATLNAPMMMMREGAACHGMFAIIYSYLLYSNGVEIRLLRRLVWARAGRWRLASFARFDSQRWS